MPCEKCKVPYPSNLVRPFINSNNPTKFLCGICALEESNRIHKDNRTKFDGKVAERFRLKAIKWREEHPQHRPGE